MLHGMNATKFAITCTEVHVCRLINNVFLVNATVSTIAGFIGKSLNAGAFYMVYLHTAEMFPTKVRNTCASTAAVIGRIGPLLSSYLVHLGKLYSVS